MCAPPPRLPPLPRPPQLCPDPLSTPLARFAPSLLGRLAEGQLHGTGGSWAVVKYSSGGCPVVWVRVLRGHRGQLGGGQQKRR